MAPPAIKAMVDAAAHFVDLHELHARVGERLASLTRNEAAYVTSGAAAGITLTVAACVAEPGQAFPVDSEVVMFASQRNGYDYAARLTGARIIEIGPSVDELRAALVRRPACVLWFAGAHYANGALPIEEVIRVASEVEGETTGKVGGRGAGEVAGGAGGDGAGAAGKAGVEAVGGGAGGDPGGAAGSAGVGRVGRGGGGVLGAGRVGGEVGSAGVEAVGRGGGGVVVGGVGGVGRVPVIVDAAAQIPPVGSLWRFTTEVGADAVIFSGGKGLRGPQSSGLVLGRQWIVDRCRAHASPYQEIGRGMKVGKEELLGLLAAVEWTLEQDEENLLARYERIVDNWIAGLQDLQGVEVRRGYPSEAGQPHSRAVVRLSTTSGWTRDGLIAALWAGDWRSDDAPGSDDPAGSNDLAGADDPAGAGGQVESGEGAGARIAVGVIGVEADEIALNPQTLEAGEELVVLDALVRLLSSGNGEQAGRDA